MTLQIRAVDVGEIEQLRDLRLRALLDAPTAFASAYGHEIERPLTDWLWWVTPPSVTFIAEDGDGSWYGMATGRLDDDGRCADVFSMWVDPCVRGQKVGVRLLDRVIEWARASGVGTVRLGVTEGNAVAEALYRGRGFRPNGVREALRSHPELTCVMMELSQPIDS